MPLKNGVKSLNLVYNDVLQIIESKQKSSEFWCEKQTLPGRWRGGVAGWRGGGVGECEQWLEAEQHVRPLAVPAGLVGAHTSVLTV